MIYLITLLIIFVYTTILWFLVIVLYNFVLEPFDFGPLRSFALKSLGLILLVSLIVTFVMAGIYASLIVWWFGLMLLFKKDFWECKVLVILIWGINLLVGLGVQMIIASFQKSPISTV